MAREGDCAGQAKADEVGATPRRHPAADYGATRLFNFRMPVDLRARLTKLVQDTEREYPWLRKPSVTELVIALLEDGPQTPGEVVEMLRRKRAAEYEER